MLNLLNNHPKSLTRILLFVFSILIPGATLVFFGKFKNGLFLGAFFVLVLIFFGLTRWITTYEGAITLLFLLVAMHLIGILLGVVFFLNFSKAAFWNFFFYTIFLSLTLLFLFIWQSTLLGVQVYKITSNSMKPSIFAGDIVIVDQWKYNNAKPKTGDIVAFKLRTGSITYIKRIAERPDYARNQDQHAFFVLGDNVMQSIDSRHFGVISPSLIEGEVLYKVYPLSPL